MINSGESKIYNPYNVYLNQVGENGFWYKQFHDKLRGLPASLQDFIFDTGPTDFIKDRVSIPLGLNQGQSQELAKIVMELIIVDIYLGNIVSEIKTRLGVDEIKAKTIAGLIVTELFSPILEELKKMHIEKFAKGYTVQRPPSQSNQNFDDRVVNLKNG